MLVNLRASADELRSFLDAPPSCRTHRARSIDELGRAARVGIPAAKCGGAPRDRARQIRQAAVDLAPNLRIVLEDFSDPARAVEGTAQSNGNGYSGAQALLRYVFSQSLVNNGFDELGYMVRAAVHTDDCSAWVDAKKAREKSQEDCRSWLGPKQFGVTVADPTAEPEREPQARSDASGVTGNG